MPAGNTSPKEPSSPNPLPPGALKIAAEMVDRAFQVANKGLYRDRLLENDSRKERIKDEIKDDIVRVHKELVYFRDYKDELSKNARDIIARIEQDITDIDRYLDDAWPAYPFEAFLSDIKALYEELEG